MPEIRLSSVLLPLPELAQQADKFAGLEVAVERIEHGARLAAFGVDLAQPAQTNERRRTLPG